MSISLGNWTHLLGRTKTIWDSEGEPHEVCVEAWGAHSCVLYAAAAPSAEAAPHSARCLCSCPGLSLSVSPAVPVYNAVVFLFVLANFSMATFMDPGVFPRGKSSLFSLRTTFEKNELPRAQLFWGLRGLAFWDAPVV